MLLGSVGVGGRERDRRARKVIHLCCALTTWGEIVQLGRGEEDETKKKVVYYYYIFTKIEWKRFHFRISAAASAVRLLASIDISVLVMPISLDTAKASSTSTTNIWQTDVPKNATPFMQDDCQEIFFFCFIIFWSDLGVCVSCLVLVMKSPTDLSLIES